MDALKVILQKELKIRQERNPGYSLRAFSGNLGIDSSNLSKILSGQLVAGEKLKKKIMLKLGLPEVDLLSGNYNDKITDDEYRYHDLNLFNIIADWYYYAILELFKLERFQGPINTKALATELGIEIEEATQAISRLINLNLIKVDTKTGRPILAEDSSSSIKNITTSAAHRLQQKQILNKAIDALDQVPIAFRSQSSMTIAINQNKLPEAIEMIKNFRRKLGRFLSDSEKLDEVYNLSISLYPITTIKKNKESQK